MIISIHRFLLLGMFFSLSFSTISQVTPENILDGLTIEQKIGQLFMIRAHSNKGSDHIREIKSFITKFEVGGLCFFQGSPEKQAELTNQYQKISNIPLFIAIDGEWGLGMRFPDNTISYPKSMVLGAIQDNNLIYKMGEEIAFEMKRIGININFAPVADVNNNPNNPVINYRSFGENKYEVTSKAFAFMKGMQDNGLLACAKHFPGHGDTDVDSHKELPIISHDLQHLHNFELMPFKGLIDQGVSSIMVAHLHVPALDDRANRPTTLSKNTIQKLLRQDLGFNGLIFTDAMEMQGVAKYFKNGEAAVEALEAGNDIILLPEDLPKAINAIQEAVNQGRITEERIDESVLRILQNKAKIGILESVFQIEKIDSIIVDVNHKKGENLKSTLIKNALTIAKNQSGIIPIKTNIPQSVAIVTIGNKQQSTFQNRCQDYVKSDQFQFNHSDLNEVSDRYIQKLKMYDKVIVTLENLHQYGSKNYGIKKSTIDFLNRLAKVQSNLLLVHFGSPYALKYFEQIPNIVVAYEDDHIYQDLAAQGVFGAFELTGKLPVSAGKTFKTGTGLYGKPTKSFGYSTPESVGMSSKKLAVLDTIVEKMIREKAAPGCQIMVVKNNKIVWDKSYGYHTYDKIRKVKNDDLYDLASLTKILATTIATMKLHEDKLLNIYFPVKQFLPESNETNKANMIVEDVLAHHAGLIPWIPFYKNTVKNKSKTPHINPSYYSNDLTKDFNVEVASDLYLRSDYRDSMWYQILHSDLRQKRDYRYSDLGFYMMHHAIENVTNTTLDNYLNLSFYKPLGLKTMTYRPLKKFPIDRIPPTEKDNYFRLQTINGYVHDMGAAMLGGVSGHAGLFSNAYDIAVLMQMLLNGGKFENITYLKPNTIKSFTKRYYRSSRRGIGFDMKETNNTKRMNMSKKASVNTFGHLGFTGTAVWVDPDEELIFIFLSNRTYPDMNNYKLNKLDIRIKLHNAIYDSMYKNIVHN